MVAGITAWHVHGSSEQFTTAGVYGGACLYHGRWEVEGMTETRVQV